MDGRGTSRRSVIHAVAWGLLLAAALPGCPEPRTRNGTEPTTDLIYEARSGFSHIRIRQRGSVRALHFVRDNGDEALETAIDLEAPHRLVVPYTRYMFLGYLFRPEQERCLIVGLGGGAMVRFLNHHFPDLAVDAVEIDPVVVKLADEYFGTRPGPKTRIFTEDAFRYLERVKDKYDVIYMDAFLKPSADTDTTGVPLHLKTIEFFKSLHANLKENGIVVFNVNTHPEMAKDLDAVKKAFPQAYVFAVPRRRNRVIIGTLEKKRLYPDDLEERGKKLDKEKDWGFYFRAMARKLRGG